MDTPSAKHPKFVRWALLAGLIIILNIFFVELVQLALPAPQYDAYCPTNNLPPAADAKVCAAQGGVWTDYGTDMQAPSAKTAPTGYCDLYSACQPLYQAAVDHHDLYAFVFMVGLGVIALLAGVIPMGSSIVSSGLSYGGVLALIIGSASYWGTAGQWVRFGIALVGLLALIYIGWKRFRD